VDANDQHGAAEAPGISHTMLFASLNLEALKAGRLPPIALSKFESNP
jgi:hypothetical protein